MSVSPCATGTLCCCVASQLTLLSLSGSFEVPGFGGATSGTVDVIVTSSAASPASKPFTVSAVAVNYVPLGNAGFSEANITSENITLTFENLSGQLPPTFSLAMIADTQVNPEAVWKQLNSPIYPTYSQIQAMIDASQLKWEPLQYEQSGTNTYIIGLTLRPFSFAFVSFDVK